jgi:transcription factor CRZ1
LVSRTTVGIVQLYLSSMDHQTQARGRSPSGASQQVPSHQSPSHIRNSTSPASGGPFSPPNTSAPSSGLGLGLSFDPPSNPAASQQYPGAQADFATYDSNNNNTFLNNQQATTYPQQAVNDPLGVGQDYTQQLQSGSNTFGGQEQGDFSQSLLGTNFAQGDFSLFPPTSGEQYNETPLFATNNQASSGNDQLGAMASSQTHANPTPPHMLQPEPHQPRSAEHSPSFNQHQFSSPQGRTHSRNTSLTPADALLPGQEHWSQNPQFQQHRRSPSEFSDVSSSAAPSPALVTQDSFDVDHSHSPAQRPVDTAVYSELNGIGNFTISDQSSPHLRGRSPSHSPAISPRILPQSLPNLQQANNSFQLATQGNVYGGQMYGLQAPEALAQQMQQDNETQLGQQPAAQMSAPTINIDYAPTATRPGFDQGPRLDADSLTPPERGMRLISFMHKNILLPWIGLTRITAGRPRSRPRASTDPYNTGGLLLGRAGSASLSPSSASEGREASRSISPGAHSAGSGGGAPSPGRRRMSTSAVPNRDMALRLADPEYNQGSSGGGEGNGVGPKRVQKHPATFQCTLCPKRFTRAYNLRSHLRTHTDERPFVCTVCGKAFARQHDRKRHESLHSGEKKFVCKGELKAGGQWGCGRRFARADALGRHFRSEAGRICIKPLLDEEMLERQRQWQEQRMAAVAQQQAQQQASMGAMGMLPSQAPPMMGLEPTGTYPVDASGQFAFPAALLAQYPALAQFQWNGGADLSGGSGMEDGEGRSSFEVSDYDEADDGGYVSGPGTGFGQGGMGEGFGEMGYASDYGGR